MDADDAGAQERFGIEDGAVDVRLGREVHHRVGLGDQRRGHTGVGDVAADEPEASGHLGVVADRLEVRLVAGIGQRVEDRDARPIAPRQDVADVARADEPGPARDEEPPRRSRLGHASGRSTGGARRPDSSSSLASSAARNSDGTVPASVQ